MSDDAKPQCGFPIAPWHRVFAWLPTDTFDQGWRWLCPIWRRRIQKRDYLDGGPQRWWQYRGTLGTVSGPPPKEWDRLIKERDHYRAKWIAACAERDEARALGRIA